MKEEIKDKTWYEEVKEDFVKNINDTYTLNLAISILEDRKELLDKNLDLQSQLKAKEEMVKVMEKYFELIIDLGFDYDGFNKADSLKSLIDELVRFAKLGRTCNITEAIYEMENKKFNILHEEILSKGGKE